MGRFLPFLLVIAVCAGAPQKRRKGPKPPELEVVEVSAHRVEGRIALDGRVRNTGDKPIQGLVLIFDFLAPGSAVITTQKHALEVESLAPGAESTFSVQMQDHNRAVRYQVSAVDQGERDLRVTKPGPYLIE